MLLGSFSSLVKCRKMEFNDMTESQLNHRIIRQNVPKSNKICYCLVSRKRRGEKNIKVC
jgi:hypothetical protein